MNERDFCSIFVDIRNKAILLYVEEDYKHGEVSFSEPYLLFSSPLLVNILTLTETFLASKFSDINRAGLYGSILCPMIDHSGRK